MLFFFGLSTPFNFSWPQEVKYRKNIIDVTEAVSRMEKGNTNRRVGLVLLGIYGVVTLARTGNRFCINGALGWLTTAYMAWILLSLTWSIDTMFTLRRITTLYLLSIGAAATALRYSIREIAVLTLYVCGITAVIALCNEIRLDTLDPPSAFWRFSGIFHTVAMGWNCGLMALAALYLASVSKTRRSRWLLHITLIAAILLLILTKSRMALISTVAALFFFWMMASSRQNKAGIILGFISLSCIAYLFMGDHIFQYLETATTLGRGEYTKESIGTLTGRLPLWQECFRWSAMKPFLGYGFNTFISPIHYASTALNVFMGFNILRAVRHR
jgi:O-antigen ligase